MRVCTISSPTCCSAVQKEQVWLLWLPAVFQPETPAAQRVAVQRLAALNDLRVSIAFWLQHQADRAQGAPSDRSASVVAAHLSELVMPAALCELDLPHVELADTVDGPAIVHNCRGLPLSFGQYNVHKILACRVGAADGPFAAGAAEVQLLADLAVAWCITCRNHLDGFKIVERHGGSPAGKFSPAMFSGWVR